MTPLRWLLLATHVPEGGVRGGMVRYVVELAAALNARADVELHVLAVPGAVPFFSELLQDRRLVHSAPPLPTPARSLAERSTFGLPLLRRGFDVVHGAKHLVPRRTTARRVLTVHDMLLFDRASDFPLLKRTALRAPYRASLRQADVLLCVSAATRARVVAEVPTAAARAAVVPLAMSHRLLAAESTAVPALLGRRFALVVGDPSPRKNLALATAVWSRLAERDPEVVLVVVGPHGWGTDEHGRAHDRLVASGHLLPLGHVDDGVLRWCYEHAAVVLCPSLLEGFGLPVVEAQAFGAPVITSTDPALVEAARGGAVALPPTVEHWLPAVGAAMSPHRGEGLARTAARTWAQVADETVVAVRAGWEGR